MCGILGTINHSFDYPLLDLISHRGPDGHGLVRIEASPHNVILGHRRLAIVELSDLGAQPMSTPNGSHTLVFNGEIYNHMDLRASLSSISFKSHSDTETLLHAISVFGISIVRRLNGIFTLAIFDSTRKKLFLARDHYGVKPIYYSFRNDRFAFSSEIAPLRQIVGSEVDSAGLTQLLKVRFVPSPSTIYKDIYRLRPGHIVEVDLSKERLEYKEYPFVKTEDHEIESPRSFSDCVAGYEARFRAAVDRQLMSDVDVGVLLSGGIDSAMVASCAQQSSSEPIKAFTVGFSGVQTQGVDEIEHAKETADVLGLQHYTTRMNFGDFLREVRECVEIVEEPLATSSIVPMRFLAKLASKHVKVVLSGQGADELLGGYRRYQLELWRRYIPTVVAQFGSQILRLLRVRHAPLVRGLRTLEEEDDVLRTIAASAVFSDSEIFRLTGFSPGQEENAYRYAYELFECSKLNTSLERMMVLDSRLGLPDDLLLYTDKITMRESIECRVPMLDLDLTRYLESLPVQYRIRLFRSKIVHKTLAAKSLPRSIVDRRKLGFLSPTKHWFGQESVLEELLLDQGSAFANWIDVKEVDKIIRQHRNGHDRERQIFLLICLYYFFDRLVSTS